jgi:hypothetical protein
LDFMVYKDKAKGDAIYAYGKANWNRLGIKYIIWYQRIDEGGGFKPMEDRGGITANHMDHNHWSFTDTGAASGTNKSADAAASAPAPGAIDLSPFTDPSTWIRVAEFLAGVVLVLILLWRLANKASGGIL